jgi:hypothetical protein
LGKSDDLEHEVMGSIADQQTEALGTVLVNGYALNIENRSGEPVLTAKGLEFWLPQFDGDRKRLSLALIEAKPEIPQRNPMAFCNGVERRLGQIAGRKLDSAANYAKAVERNGKPKSPEFVPHRVSTETRLNLRPAGYDMGGTPNGR